MELLIKDVALHRFEMTLLTIAFIVSVVVGAVYAVYAIIRWREKDVKYRDEDSEPECMKTCVNVHDECKQSEGECLRYEPRRITKKFNPVTGEVESK